MQPEQHNLSQEDLREASEDSQGQATPTEKTQGRWNTQEHLRFLSGLFKYGKNWKDIQGLVETRLCSQVRSHAQKYFIKLHKILKDRKKQKTRLSPELTLIEKEILQNFGERDITPKTPEILVTLLQQPKQSPNIKLQQENQVNEEETQLAKNQTTKKIVKVKKQKNDEQNRNLTHQNNQMKQKVPANQGILDSYFQNQYEERSFLSQLLEKNVQHFKQGRDFTDFIDFKGHNQQQIPKPDELQSDETTRNRRESFTLVSNQQNLNNHKLIEALEDIKNGSTHCKRQK